MCLRTRQSIYPISRTKLHINHAWATNLHIHYLHLASCARDGHSHTFNSESAVAVVGAILRPVAMWQLLELAKRIPPLLLDLYIQELPSLVSI